MLEKRAERMRMPFSPFPERLQKIYSFLKMLYFFP